MKKFVQEPLITCAAFCGVLFFFPPLQAYLPQPEEFRIGLADVTLFSGAIFILMVILSVGALAILKSRRPKFAKGLLAVMRGLTIAIFVQNCFFTWHYGAVGQRAIPWGNFSYGLIDTPFWILCLFLAWRYRGALAKVSPKLAAFFLIYSSFHSVFLFLENRGHHKYGNTPSREDNVEIRNSFSTNKNVIVVVIDELQSDFFEELTNSYPNLKTDLDGFTYYRNATACYAYTHPSVPNILSGEKWSGARPWDELGKELMARHFLPRELKEKGFHVDLHMGPSGPFEPDDTMAELVPTHSRSPWMWLKRKVGRMSYVYDFALFKVSPHYVKRFVMNDYQWVFSGRTARFSQRLEDVRKLIDVSSDEDLLELNRNGRVEDFYVLTGLAYPTRPIERNVFKYFHLMGAHYPWTITERLAIDHSRPLNPSYSNDLLVFKTPEDLKTARASYRGQAYAYIQLVQKALFEKLKASGLWDNSLIFLIADHGNGNDGFDVRPTEAFGYQGDKGAALPMVLMKPFGAHGAMKMSDAPIELGDIPKTILGALGLPNETYGGLDITQISPDEKRKRHFSIVNLRAEPGSRHISHEGSFPIYEYEIDGFAWDDRSWRVNKVIR
ncbi:MAG: sulfatase-like hydrolase/transferase [Deltaproteobacteria bacterium]|nr:sulfatase-like hydrolase/transferase [Deltaproteobacteria bacterium]